jgi:hypothetical protein
METSRPPPGTQDTKKRKRNPVKIKVIEQASSFYLKENRGRIREDNKGANNRQFQIISAKEWAELDPKDKKQYEDKNAEDKKRYRKEMGALPSPTQKTKRRKRNPVKKAKEESCENKGDRASLLILPEGEPQTYQGR